MKISKGIGIDLGTTNSAVAVMNLTDSEIVMYEDNMRVSTTPSCVWYDDKKQTMVVGRKAFRRRGGRPEPIISIKRKMGTTGTVKLAGREMTPEEVSAEILKEMRQQIEETLRTKLAMPDVEYIVDRAIVTIPAYFKLPAVEATRKAAEMAGLELIDLLHEPTAAAIHYAWKHGIVEDSTFLVFDPGGGTFDVSIVRRRSGEPEVLGISGDTFLGGDDLDRCLAELIRKRLAEDDYDVDLDVKNPDDALLFAQLVLLAEGVKKQLSTAGETLLRNSTLTDKSGATITIETMITREEFENEIRDLIEKMVPKCWEALAKAYKKSEITLKDIDYILLVGGTSYVPLVQETARVHFCNCADPRELTPESLAYILDNVEPEHRDTVRYLIGLGERAKCTVPVFEDPDTCNARGAAIQAALDGLAVYNDELTMRVKFREQGAAAGAQTTVSGQVEVSAAGDGKRAWTPLINGKIVISLAEAGFKDTEVINEKGNFRFKNVPLQAGTVNQFSFEVYGPDSKLLGTVGRPIAQRDDAVNLGSGVLKANVLPTPIRIEGMAGKRRIKKDIVPETSPLPIEKDFVFALDDNPGFLTIPLYQGNQMIYEIQVDIDPNLPPGTPIDFHISIDEKAFIAVKGRVGEQEFAATIEPPKVEAPSPEQVEQRVQELREALSYRSAGDAVVHKKKADILLRDIAEARNADDEPKVIERYQELGTLLEQVTTVHAGLQPAKEEFDALVHKCLRLAAQLANSGQGRNVDEMEKNIRFQQQEGERAAQSMDQEAYTQAYQMLVELQQVLEGALQELAQAAEQTERGAGAAKRPPADPAEEAQQYLEHFLGMTAQLQPYAAAKAQELQQKANLSAATDPRRSERYTKSARTCEQMQSRLAAIEHDLAALRPTVRANPDQVIRSCQSVQADIKRIYEVLERVSSDEGLLGLPRI